MSTDNLEEPLNSDNVQSSLSLESFGLEGECRVDPVIYHACTQYYIDHIVCPVVSPAKSIRPMWMFWLKPFSAFSN